MAKQKKWNNQGGSGRGDKPKQDKKPLPNIPAFDKLPESNEVSFRIVKPRKSQPDYGQFGDEFYTNWQLLDESEFEQKGYGDFDNGELPELTDGELEFDLDRNPRNIPLPIINTEFASETKSKDLLPKESYKEYEIIVKFKKLILTILSGQAYAARNELNNPLLDFAIVIVSSEAIAIAPNPSGTLNIIQRLGSAQDPMFAVYNWVLEKLELTTDNTGKVSPDPTLLKIARRGVLPLPPTSFNWNGDEWNLFNGTGKEPTQICLHATNDVVKFEPSTPKSASWLWTVLNCGEPLALCKSLDEALRFIGVGITPDLYYLIVHYDRPDKFFYPDDVPADLSVFKAALIIYNPTMTSIEDVVAGGNWTVTYLDNTVDKIYRFNQDTEDASVPADAVDIPPNRSSRIFVPGGKWQLSNGDYLKFSDYNYAPSPSAQLNVDLTFQYGVLSLINIGVPAFEATFKTHFRNIKDNSGDVYQSESVDPITLAVTAGQPVELAYTQIGSTPFFEATASGTIGDTVEIDTYSQVGIFNSSSASTIYTTPVYSSANNGETRKRYEEIKIDILEKELRSFFYKETVLIGVGGIRLNVEKTAPLDSVFELEGTVTEIKYTRYRTFINPIVINGTLAPAGSIDCASISFPSNSMRENIILAASYQRRSFVRPVTTTVSIGSDVIDTNAFNVKNQNVSANISGSTIQISNLNDPRLKIPGVVVRSDVDTVLLNRPASIPAYTNGNLDLLQQPISSRSVRNLEVNPKLAQIKYAVLITPTRIYNLAINSKISNVTIQNKVDPVNGGNGNRLAILDVDGIHSNFYGFYPTGHIVLGGTLQQRGKYRTDFINDNRPFGFRVFDTFTPEVCKIAIPTPLINCGTTPDFGSYYSPYYPSFAGWMVYDNFRNATGTASLFTAINSPDPQCPNTNYIRNITGFDCTIDSTYDIDAPWISGNTLIVPDAYYFATDNTLMGRNNGGVVEIYKSNPPAASLTGFPTCEKWIVNSQNRFELVDLFKGEISETSQIGADFSVQYYPY